MIVVMSMVVPVVMVVVVVPVVMVVVVVPVVFLLRLGLATIVPDQADAEDTRHDGCDKTDDRSHNGGDEAEKSVRDEDGVGPGFRRRNQEGHAG